MGIQILFCWLGTTELNAASGLGDVGLGPIAQAAVARPYDEIVLLNNWKKARAEEYAAWVQKQSLSRTSFRHISLSTPTNFVEIYQASTEAISKKIEIHMASHPATVDFLRDSFQKIIPEGLQVTLYQWQEKSDGQKLHNRYILTDLGGVSFHHGLDTGRDGETDDISRLASKQYECRCRLPFGFCKNMNETKAIEIH